MSLASTRILGASRNLIRQVDGIGAVPDSPNPNDIEFSQIPDGSTVTDYLSWVNQGTRTAAIAGGKLMMYSPSGNGGGLVVAAPSGSFTVTTRLTVYGVQAGYDGPGMIALDDSPLNTYGSYRLAYGVNPADKLYGQTYNSSWAYASEIPQLSRYTSNGGPFYLRMVYDSGGGTLALKFSFDSYTWIDFQAATSRSAPTYVGVGFQAYYGTVMSASFDFIRFDWTP